MGRQNQISLSSLSNLLRFLSSLNSVFSLFTLDLSDLGSLCLSLFPCLWRWFCFYVSLWLHLSSDYHSSRLSLSLVPLSPPPHHPLISVAVPQQWEVLAPMAGWLWSRLWVGSPRLLQRGTRIPNTCSLWQPATTAHCLPTSHFNLKRENCQTNVLATAPCQGCLGSLTAAPARSESWEEIGEGVQGCLMLWGILAATLSGLAGSEYQSGCLESPRGSPCPAHCWAGQWPVVLPLLSMSLPAPRTHRGCLLHL